MDKKMVDLIWFKLEQAQKGFDWILLKNHRKKFYDMRLVGLIYEFGVLIKNDKSQ